MNGLTRSNRRRLPRRSNRISLSPTKRDLAMVHVGRKVRLYDVPPSVSYNKWNPLTLIGSADVGESGGSINLTSSDVISGIQSQLGLTVATGTTLEFRLLEARVYNITTPTAVPTSPEQIRVIFYDPDNSDVVLADTYDLSNRVTLAGVGFKYPKSRSSQPFSADNVLTVAQSSSSNYITYLYLLWRAVSTSRPAVGASKFVMGDVAPVVS